MKNRNIIVVVAALLLAWSVTATAALDAIEQGYELATSELTLPAHTAGQVVINSCAECESAIHPVNSQTTYHIGRRTAPVPLADFRSAVQAEVGTFIHLAYNIETGYVTRITLTPSQ